MNKTKIIKNTTMYRDLTSREREGENIYYTRELIPDDELSSKIV